MIEKAIDHFGGSRSALCKAIGMSPQFLSQVCTGKRPLPPRYAVLIEKKTSGKVKAAELLPDVFSPSDEKQSSANAAPIASVPQP
ncbi:transcriptional regulator [Vreelandella aquamarina]|jgi:DNA-binding transcriptional regulator YdaS (Cro superfamily)|uniref:transcriptional regulator n=1 Tax=Vreelandella aquamarina TaxID=77097 RepID=UPI000696DA53|nr:YdaS family helix-turn-helix protein [Halomonas meridiana]